MSLRNKVKEYDKKYSSGSFHKLQSGQNQVRILTEPELYDDAYDGEPIGSFISYVLVRDAENGDSLAVLTLPKIAVRWLADEEDLGKFTSYPMPYDIMIFKQKSGDKTNYVSVAVDAANSPAITGSQTDALRAAKPIAELAQALSKKKAKNLPAPMPPAQLVEGSLQAKKNHAEANASFISFQNAIKNCDSGERLDNALSIISTSSSLTDFEKEMLQEQIKNKKISLGLVEPDKEITVEDIPF